MSSSQNFSRLYGRENRGQRRGAGLSPAKLGKVASALGLGQCSIGKDRGRTVPKEKIHEFKTTVGSVGTVGIPCAARGNDTDSSVGQVSATVGDIPPANTLPTDADSTPTDASDSKIIEAQDLPTVPTVPTDNSRG